MEKRSSMCLALGRVFTRFFDVKHVGVEKITQVSRGFHGTIGPFDRWTKETRGQPGRIIGAIQKPLVCGDSVVNIGKLACHKSQWGNARWRWRIVLSIRWFSMHRNEVVAPIIVVCEGVPCFGDWSTPMHLVPGKYLRGVESGQISIPLRRNSTARTN